MPTSNERIRDLSVSRQVDVTRLARRFGNQLVKTLNRGEPRLRAQLRAILERPRSDRPKAIETEVKRIRTVIDREEADTWKVLRSDTDEGMIELAEDETRFLDRMILAAVPVALILRKPERSELVAAMRTEQIAGLPIREHFRQARLSDRERMVQQVRLGRSFNEGPSTIMRRLFGTRALRGTDAIREATRRGIQALGNTFANGAGNLAKGIFYGKNRRHLRRELYVAVLDNRTTPICRSLDGSTHRVGEGPRPPLHIRCRSIRVPIVDAQITSRLPLKDSELERLGGVRGQIRRAIGPNPGKVTYEAWLHRQSAAFQNEILGPTRGKLFRKGNVSLGSFVDASGMQLRLDELKIREPAAFRAAGIKSGGP